jgi:uncharacterized phage-associated protein
VTELKFTFDREKAIEAILYLAARIDDPTFHSIGKLMYFSDKTSLERYGRFICGDDYYAMQWGPVPTHTYDLLKDAARGSVFPFTIQGHSVAPSRPADTDLLSESDIDCLDASIRLYGYVPMWKRHEDSADRAYKQAWEQRGNTASVRMPIEDIATLLDDGDELIDFLANRGSEQSP